MANVRANKPPKPTDRIERGKTRPHAVHTINPPGTKLLKKAHKAKFGVKEFPRDIDVEDTESYGGLSGGDMTDGSKKVEETPLQQAKKGLPS